MMTFTIDVKKLQETLAVSKLTVAAGGGDIMSHYLFRKNLAGTGLEVLSYSGRMFSSCPLPCEFEGDESFTVEADRLEQWLAALGEDSSVVFSYADKVVSLTSTDPAGTIRLQSLDPGKWYYWDDGLNGITKTMTLGAKRAKNILAHLKEFISKDETKTPQFCVAELRKGIFYATDRQVATVVEAVGSDAGTVRIFGGNIAKIISFVGLCGDGEIEVFERDTFIVYKRADGATIGEARSMARFPDLDLGTGKSDLTKWGVKREKFLQLVRYLAAGRPTKHESMSLKIVDGRLELKMPSAAGGDCIQNMDCVIESAPDAPALPEGGISMNFEPLVHILGKMSEETIQFGVNAKPSRGGWVRFKSEKDGDTYHTVITWKI